MSGASPLDGLRLRTARLELRLPTDAELVALGRLAVQGVHDPSVMPFAIPWTDAPPDALVANALAYHRGLREARRPEEWDLSFAVWRGAELVGMQTLAAQAFAARREVSTGSWLGRAFQRQGFGREMRAAVLHLAFAGLGARVAWSGAFADNPASARVSLALGYVLDRVDTKAPRGEPREHHHFRLDRAAWEAHRQVPVEVEGLDACRALLGA